MKNEKIEDLIEWVVKNWEDISDDFKVDLKPNNYSNKIENLNLEGYIVILLLNRQKPSVEISYDFDEERIGINKQGKIIWGFDSGCSCPEPWSETKRYNVTKTWKEFVITNIKDFDKEWEKEIIKKIKEIQTKLNENKLEL